MNVWAYLFRNLNKSIKEIRAMAVMENKKEFVEGIITTLTDSISGFKNIAHKIEIEE